ncbi:MAG TPA: winged helix-turn-helix domain-containing protein [Terriglobales bacterium]|nr:winged helix-turn-helix domain-containing protein [Terriglobales bacterium]
MDLILHQAARSGQMLNLTVREFEVLEYLLRHKGTVVSRESSRF